MRKDNNQLIAIFTLIPMLIFTFIVTLNNKEELSYDEAEYVIYKYFDYKNNKDLESLSKLLINQDNLHELESSINSIEKVSLLNIYEENSKSIMDAYIRNDANSKSENVKVFKVSYEIYYNTKELSHKNGIYESWYFLTRKTENSKWLIDIYDV